MVGDLADIDGYRSYIAGMLGFRRAVEPAPIEAMRRTGWSQWRPVLLGADLERDAADLDVVAPRRGVHAEIQMSDDLFGWLYVLEGSALGAHVIAMRVRPLGVDGSFGGRHLARQVAGSARWRDFVALLERAPLSIERTAEAADSAFRQAADALAGETAA